MDCVTALPSGGDKSYNSCLVIVDRYRKTPVFLSCHKGDTAMDTALLMWKKVVSHTAYHPQIDGLEEIMIQTLENMITRLFAYSLELKDYNGFSHDWGKTPRILGKGWNLKLPVYIFQEDSVDIKPTQSRFNLFLDKVRHHANQSITDAFEYANQKWDECHKNPESKLGTSILVLTFILNNIKGPSKLKDLFAGPFNIKALHKKNAVQVELSGELENKHPTFLVSLVKYYTSSDKEVFPLRNEKPLEVPPLDKIEEKNSLKVLKERGLREKMRKNTYSGPETHNMKMSAFKKVK
ncbi:hypothetical protein O181_037281 [Austropuccinia psidii MF-1]|uniref:Integrase catalytic domain-containing protein n=1 Tax=Austropuccinia psidii MF-1 TaxID=1389203 RepID=A0A9Q3D5W1_9BASI|nr:hypothetical protein [Austropuccinia psidii MF-1]